MLGLSVTCSLTLPGCADLAPIQQFWWSWYVNVAVAVGTMFLAIAALFGDAIKSRLFRPSLSVRVADGVGELTQMTLTFAESTRIVPARLYHLRVATQGRWPHATGVQVFITNIERSGPDGNLVVEWRGEAPMRWRHQEVYPVMRTVGSDADCDFVAVVKDKWLQLWPLVTPNNMTLQYRTPTHLVVAVQVRANEVAPVSTKIEVAWDGKWHEGDSEMARHFTVRQHQP